MTLLHFKFILRLWHWTIALTLGWIVLAAVGGRAKAEFGLLERWELTYPNHPEVGQLVFADGLFVGLSASGLGPPFTSKDGVQWSHVTVHADTWTNGFSEVAYGDGSFVGVTRNGQVLLSSGATNWTATSFTPVAGTESNGNIHIAAGNGIFVTASDLGDVSVSSDAVDWSQPRLLAGCPRRLWFGNGVFVALLACSPTNSSGVWTSTDGVSWNGPPDALASSIIDVSFSDGIFTAVTSQYEFLISANARDWLRAGTVPLDSDWPATYFIHGNGRFVGFSVDPTGEGVIVSSADGTTWTQGPAVVEPKGVAFGNGRFIVSGRDILISEDGQAWTKEPIDDGALPTSVTYGNGRFVAVGGKAVLSSVDGSSWQRVPNPGSGPVPVGVYFAHGLFLGPSWPVFDEEDLTNQQGVLMTSLDGLAWTAHAGPPFLSSLRSIVYGAGTFVAIGDGSHLYASTDGLEWRETGQTEYLSSVLFGNGTFLAAAQVQSGTGGQTIIYSSADGLGWKPLTTINGRLVRLTSYGNGLFFAQALESANRFVLTSSDGSDWTVVYTGLNPGIADGAYSTYAAGRFVILSPYTVLSSPDAVNWLEQRADVAEPLADQALHPAIAFGRGTFVSVARGMIQQSAIVPPPYSVQVVSGGESPSQVGGDLGKFTFARSGTPEIDIGLRVFFQIGGSAQMGLDYAGIADSIVILAGQTSASLRITRAADATNSEEKTVVLTLLPDETYAIGSPSSATLQLADAKPLASPVIERLEDGSIKLTVDGLPGQSYLVEVSSDLINWDSLVAVPEVTGLMEFTDPDAPNFPNRFYRLRSLDLTGPVSAP